MGRTLRVAAGVRWLRSPLPFRLNHINLWIVDDGDGHALVDTGLASDEARAVWRALVADRDDPVRPSRVLATHLHPDHAGLAAWLGRAYGVDLWMTRLEYLTARNWLREDPDDPDEAHRAYWYSAGFGREEIVQERVEFGGYAEMMSGLPDAFQRLEDGMQITLGRQRWQVLVGSGHSPEHACFWCEALGVVITGDQLLPTISSIVQLPPVEPYSDPLADWLRSCAKLRARLPEDVLVLPAHGEPFRGAHARLDSLVAEVAERLHALGERLSEPRTAVDLTAELYPRQRLGEEHFRLAVSETLAYLSHLCHRGELQRDFDDDGRWRFRRAVRPSSAVVLPSLPRASA